MDDTDLRGCLERLEKRFQIQEEQMLFLTHKLRGAISSRSEDNISCHKTQNVDYEEYKRHSALNVLNRHVRDFWNNVSLPGFKYVGEPGRPRSDRYIWIVLILLGLFVSAKYIENAYTKWQGSPVLLSFNETLTPIAHIPFPAVTVCPGHKVNDEMELQQIFDTWNNTRDITQKQKDLMSAANLLCTDSTDLKQDDFIMRYYNSSFLVSLDEVSVKCDYVIDDYNFGQFIFGPDNSTCDSYFQTIYGDDNNVCFTFNMLPVKRMFKENVIPPIKYNSEYEHLPIKSKWTPDSIIKWDDPEDSIPIYIEKNGRKSGLLLTLVSSNNKCGICQKFKSHTKIYFHHSAELPLLSVHESVDLDQKEDVFVRLYPSVTVASDELREYDPKTRGCYFSDERPLSLFKFYTQRNCQMECEANCSLSICDCVPLFHPRINDSVKICGIIGGERCFITVVQAILDGYISWRDAVYNYRKLMSQRYQTIFKHYRNETTEGLNLTDEILSQNYPDCRCDCLPECTSVRYYSKIEDEESLEQTWVEKIKSVAISYKELEVTSLVRKELIGFTDFIADSGGVLGVFAGFSFLAFFELIYFITFRLWSSIKQAWEDEMEECGVERRVDIPNYSTSGDEDVN